jgi:hypothetical protein
MPLSVTSEEIAKAQLEARRRAVKFAKSLSKKQIGNLVPEYTPQQVNEIHKRIKRLKK